MMKHIVNISRIIVGNLFIFSGIVKANDPLGFSYKLEEYFIEFGMNWGWLLDIAVPLAAILCIVEIVLGVAVLVGYKMKPTSWALLLMIVFFTILTGASAIFEIVRSCGCFGDAIPLTPWQSFYKDLVLLVLIVVIFLNRNKIKPWESINSLIAVFAVSTIILALLAVMLKWSMAGEVLLFIWLTVFVHYFTKNKNLAATVAVAFSLLFGIYITVVAVNYLPFKDFRPYAITKNIPSQMVMAEGAKQPVYENTLIYENTVTGEVKSFTQEEYTASKLWEQEEWEWRDTKSKLIEEGELPPITDFMIMGHDGQDYTDIMLNEDRLMLIIAYDLEKAVTKNWDEVSALAQKAEDNGVTVIGLSAAGTAEKEAYTAKYNLPFEFYISDEIVLKTIIRSNPGVVLLEQGTVVDKWHVNKLPSLEKFLK